MRIAAGLLPIVLLGIVTPADAAPKLRLSSTTVGPVSIAQGSNGSVQTIEAFNGGDGNLNLSTTSTANWVSATIGGPRGCTTREGTCLPVNFTLQTSALAKGTFTAAVTIMDGAALDAPQIVTVTVQMGGGVPDSATLYVPPSGSFDEVKFITNSQIFGNATTQSGGSWLSLSLDGSGSFRFVMPYRIAGRFLEGMGEGTYNGSVVVSGSSVASENKTVPVTLVVTSQPIARSAPTSLSLRLAPNAPVQQTGLTIYNGGMGTLEVNGATAATSSGGSWLSVSPSGNSVVVSANSSGLATGSYSGTVTINSNAANSNLVIPIQLTVVPQGAALSTADGVVNAGNQDTFLAQGGIATVNGEQLSTQDLSRYTQAPLGETLAGVRVLVNDQAAPLYAAAYNQVSFQVPYTATTGEGVVRVERDGQPGNAVSVQISPRAPRILQQGDYGVVMNKDGTLTSQRPAKAGEVVTLYAVGLGGTTPTVATGEAAPMSGPFARITPAPRVLFGNAFSGFSVIDPVFAGLTPNAVGLYQVTFVLPADSPIGELTLAIEGDDYRSNTVLISVRQ